MIYELNKYEVRIEQGMVIVEYPFVSGCEIKMIENQDTNLRGSTLSR